METITTKGGYIITQPIDVLLTTCNRLERSKETIEELYKRIKTPFRLIVVDNASIDGTFEYLQQLVKDGKVHVLETIAENENICQALNLGFKSIESEYFICIQDDITVCDLEPCIIQQLIDLMESNKDHGAVGCRIQRIPNLQTNLEDENFIPARSALSAYFRIQRKDDFEGRDNPFGNRTWDDFAFIQIVRDQLGKRCSWAKDLWVDHSRGYCANRGYNAKPRRWGGTGSAKMKQAVEHKPYPKVDTLTCKPLPGEKCFR